MQKNLFSNIKQLLKIGVYVNANQFYNQRVLNHLFLGYRQKMAVYHYDILIEYFLLIRVFLFNILRKQGSVLFYDDSRRFEPLLSFYGPLLKQQTLLGRWVPGTFTNYHLLQHRRPFSGVKLTHMPDVIFYFNLYDNDVLLKEAFRFNIPVISIVDANTKFLFYYTYILPGNKQSYKFVIFIFYLLSYYIFKYSKMVYKQKRFQKRKPDQGVLVKKAFLQYYYSRFCAQLKFDHVYRQKFGHLHKKNPIYGESITHKRWRYLHRHRYIL